MNLAMLKKLASLGESADIEFKKSTADLNGACESLCGMLNAGLQAQIVIGIFNEKLVGQEVTDRTQQEIAQSLKYFTPDPQIKCSFITLEKTRKLILLEARSRQEQIPYFFRGKAYLRVGTTTTLLSRDHLQSLFVEQHRQAHPYDQSDTKKYQLEDLDLEWIKRAVELGISANRLPISARGTAAEILKKLELMNGSRLTQAAVILFGKSTIHLPAQCTLMLARFKGVEKGEFLDHKEFVGNAFEALNEGMLFLSRHLPLKGKVERNSLQRTDEPLIPTEALREALVNAICHRDYERPGSSIHLAIYDDRVEIISSGGLMPGIRISDLKKPHKSFPRNPLIAKIFYCVGYVERWGQGTVKMAQLCRNCGLSEPEFTEHPLWFGISFKAPVNQQKSQKLLLDSRREQILELIKSHNKLTINELIALLPMLSRRTLQRELQILKEAKRVDVSGQGTRSTLWVAT